MTITMSEQLIELIRDGTISQLTNCLPSASARSQINSLDTRSRKTPLIMAVLTGSLPKVCTLIQAGADVNLGDRQKNSPLHFAVSHGKAPLARYLLNAGADVNACDFQGKTPLHLSCEIGLPALTQLLLKSGASPYASTVHCATPTHYAAARRGKNSEILRITGSL